jgi:outer membrane protein, multidrug efflux system
MKARRYGTAGIGGMAALTLTVLLSGCDLAPIYHPPAMVLPPQYSGMGPFVKADPGGLPEQRAWWTIYDDSELDKLERKLNASNPDLKAAVQTYEQARYAVAAAHAGLLPQLGMSAGTSDNGESAHTLFHSSTGPRQQVSNGYGLEASWALDFWGEASNRVRVAQSGAQGSAAQLAVARLSLETELASDYMAIRGLDAEHAAYGRAIALYRNALQITQTRFAGRIAAGLDVARAQNQLASAQAADIEVLGQRSVLEHAVAVLAGENPIGFHLASESVMHVDVPVVPVSVPSLLLQRRPDIAAAERRMAAANAAIGIARAAFYPNVRLAAQAGFEDTGWGLAALPNSLWAVGASAMLPLFDGGLRRAQLQASWSTFAQTGDQYRATVLQAFREVEDNLVLTDRLEQESREQGTALAAAKQVQKLALTLYTGGIDNYLNVTVAQIAALNAQIATIQLKTRRLQTSVALIGALGGGWSRAELPAAARTMPARDDASRTQQAAATADGQL